jgi:hypothetical protein
VEIARGHHRDKERRVPKHYREGSTREVHLFQRHCTNATTRIVGTYEQLVASGIAMPLPILGRRMNIRVRDGISVLTEHVVD